MYESEIKLLPFIVHLIGIIRIDCLPLDWRIRETASIAAQRAILLQASVATIVTVDDHIVDGDVRLTVSPAILDAYALVPVTMTSQ